MRSIVFSLRPLALIAFAFHLCIPHVAGQDRAYVLCEGAQDIYSGAIMEFPRVGFIDLSAEEPVFEVLHVFEGLGYASDLIFDEAGSMLYVAADDVVYRLDATTGAVLAEQALQGARRLALDGGRLFVSRGDYDPLTWASVPFDHYLVALDAETLAWDAGWEADGATGPAWATEGMCIHDGALFVGVNNAFAYGEEVGLIGRLELESGNYSEVDLGEAGLNPVHLFVSEDGVVSVNAQQYDGTSLSRREPDGTVSTLAVADVTAGCGAAAMHEGGVMYQVYGEGGFRKADGQTLEALEGWEGNGNSVYSMAMVEGNRAVLGMTDFSTTGHVEFWHLEDGLLWSCEVGVSPGRMVVSSPVADVPSLWEDRGEVVGAFDVLGRPLPLDAPGFSIQLWSNGSVTKAYRTAD